METYEPLKPPAIARDDAGRFERKGRLAKAAKFRQEQPAKRRPGGRPFQPGMSGNPAGKPKGTLNRTTLALKEAVLAAGAAVGGEGGLVSYLTRLAIENSSAFSSLLAKCLPHTPSTSRRPSGQTISRTKRSSTPTPPPDSSALSVVTPKALPAPDTSHALPNSSVRSNSLARSQ